LQGSQACSQKAYFGLLQALSEDRRKFIIAADLGHLLQLHPVNIRRHMCRWLAEKYDVKAKAFIIKDKPIQITINDVENILGISSDWVGENFYIV
jgi:hypothetical protein